MMTMTCLHCRQTWPADGEPTCTCPEPEAPEPEWLRPNPDDPNGAQYITDVPESCGKCRDHGWHILFETGSRLMAADAVKTGLELARVRFWRFAVWNWDRC